MLASYIHSNIMKMKTLNIILVSLYLPIDTVLLHAISTSYKNLNITRESRQFLEEYCILPFQPDYGQWVLQNGNVMQPGDAVLKSTVLVYSCNSGYKLLPAESQYVVCIGATWNTPNLPSCEQLCPPIQPTSTIRLSCHDRQGNETSCKEATDGTYLSYTCVDFYEPPSGYKRILSCFNGNWDHPKPQCQPVCGRKVGSIDSVPLIYNVEDIQIIEYPWIVAVYKKDNDLFKNICGGSLLSETVVLTAAHCVTNNYGDKYPSELFAVGVGKIYNKYKDGRDINAQYLNIHYIVVQEYYKGGSSHYLSDIALLITERPFIMTKWVQPVCFRGINDIVLHAGDLGMVLGWGITEEGRPSQKLRMLQISHKYEPICTKELPKDWSNKYNLIDKICDGFVNKSISLCKGDSGSGLFFPYLENNRYYVHGIASLGLFNDTECHIQQNSLYTKVAYYYDFVDKVLTKYSIKYCFLPQHPEDGKWIIEDKNKKPGDTVPSNTVLKIICKKGYNIVSGSSTVKCDTQDLSYKNMPSCQLICPKLIFPPETVFECQNKEGKKIDCHEATEFTTLTYECPKGFVKPPKSSDTSQCVYRSWGMPEPSCKERKTYSEIYKVKKTKQNKTKVVCVYNTGSKSMDVEFEDISTNNLCNYVSEKDSLSMDGHIESARFNLTLNGLIFYIVALLVVLVVVQLIKFIIDARNKCITE